MCRQCDSEKKREQTGFRDRNCEGANKKQFHAIFATLAKTARLSALRCRRPWETRHDFRDRNVGGAIFATQAETAQL